MNLALFDFDGTITTHDSLRDFLLYAFGIKHCIKKLAPVSPMILGYLFGIADNQKVKTEVSKSFFSQMAESEFSTVAKRFATEELDKIVKKSAIEKIAWHKSNKDRVIVVSASFTDYLKYWCEKEGLELISTRLEVKDGKLTGYFSTPNCWGKEKVRRINEYLNIKDFEKIYAYGDSKGDLEMLNLAHEKGYRIFK
ncbi:MAG: HAD-IB family hydrolase [Candidatus Riflebacteria bacterium]|nr:HAD-IB family hydrolase [Candidatus Riflebacteria bacterium]